MDTEKSAGGGGDSGGSTVSASSFRAKVVQMKNWKPKNTPSVSVGTRFFLVSLFLSNLTFR